MNIQEIYDYAKLATLSYVDLSGYAKGTAIPPRKIVDEGISDQNPGKTKRIAQSLGEQMFAPALTADVTGKSNQRGQRHLVF